MKVVLYGVNFQDAPFPGNLAVLTQAARNRGYLVKQLNGKFFGRLGGDVEAEPADLAFVSGARDGFGLIPSLYRPSNVPCYVNDLGWMRREWNYFQLCPYKLNTLYTGSDYPTDRLEKLKLEIKPRRRGSRILICSQLEGDAQHDLKTQVDVSHWVRRVIEDLRKVTNQDIVFRPHPRSRFMCHDADYWSDPKEHKLDECIYRHDIGLAIMYNSTSAFECLMAGVPVIALGKDVMYGELTGNSLDHVTDPFYPDNEQLVRFLSKVAYHQYTTDELSSWKPIEFMLEKHREHLDLLQQL